MKHDDVSIIIQGPISEITLFALSNYSKYAEVILSFSFSSTETNLFKNFFGSKFKIVTYKESEILQAKKNLNNGNEAYQFYSTKIAAEASNKKFCIKTRSDEYYENIDYFINYLKNNENLVVTNNVFFRRFEYWRFHPSDHIFASKTELMKNAFKILWDSVLIKDKNERYEKYKYYYALKKDKDWHSPIPYGWIAPEQYIAISYINAIKIKLNITEDEIFNDDKFFKKWFRMINVSDLKPYKISYNSNKNGHLKYWINNYTPDIKYDQANDFIINKMI
jgi:hypothetical protein